MIIHFMNTFMYRIHKKKRKKKNRKEEKRNIKKRTARELQNRL